MKFTLYRLDSYWNLENSNHSIRLCTSGIRRIFGNILSRKDTYNVWIKPSKSGVLQYQSDIGSVRIQHEDGHWSQCTITSIEFDQLMREMFKLRVSDKELRRFNVWYQKIEPSV